MPLNIIHKEDIFCGNSQKNQRTNSNVNYEIGDVQLWQEFQSGSEKAYATIYKNNVSLLYSYGLKLVHNKDLVKDAIQDLFVELWNNRNNLGKVTYIKPYLYKSIRRKLIAESIKSRRTETIEKATFLEPLITPSFERLLIEKQLYNSQLEELKKALIKLTSKQHEILHLKFNAQLSYDEITQIMSLSKKGVYKLMDRAIQTLRKHMCNVTKNQDL